MIRRFKIIHIICQNLSDFWVCVSIMVIHISDWLDGSHVMQYCCGYCKFESVEGTVRVPCSYCDVSYRASSSCSTLKVPSTVLQLTVPTTVLVIWDQRSQSGGIWMCKYSVVIRLSQMADGCMIKGSQVSTCSVSVSWMRVGGLGDPASHWGWPKHQSNPHWLHH